MNALFKGRIVLVGLVLVEIKVDRLAAGMDPTIGSTGSHHLDNAPKPLFQDGFDFSLDGIDQQLPGDSNVGLFICFGCRKRMRFLR